MTAFAHDEDGEVGEDDGQGQGVDTRTSFSVWR